MRYSLLTAAWLLCLACSSPGGTGTPVQASHAPTLSRAGGSPVAAVDSLAERGIRVFDDANCLHCHSLAGRGGQMGPELAGVADRRSREWLYLHFLRPDSVTPTTLMPAFGPDSVARALTALVSTFHAGRNYDALIQPYLAAEQEMRTLPEATFDGTRVPEGVRVFERYDEGDTLVEVLVENVAHKHNHLIVLQDRFVPESGQLVRYRHDRLVLERATLVIDSAQSELRGMGGMNHTIIHSNDVLTLVAARPGTINRWAESRRLAAHIYFPAMLLISGLDRDGPQRSAAWLLNTHGGQVPLLIERIPRSSIPGNADLATALVFRVATAGSDSSAQQWLFTEREPPYRVLRSVVGPTATYHDRTELANAQETSAVLARIARDTAAHGTVLTGSPRPQHGHHTP